MYCMRTYRRSSIRSSGTPDFANSSMTFSRSISHPPAM